MTKQLTHVEIHLPYFKQGDDLGWCLEKTDNNVLDALDMHMKMLESTIMQLKEIKNIIRESGKDGFELEADTHYIGLSGPTDVLEKLVKAEVVELDMFDDDEEDWDDEDDEEEDWDEEDETDDEEVDVDKLNDLDDYVRERAERKN
jgi:hypothetical protein